MRWASVIASDRADPSASAVGDISLDSLNAPPNWRIHVFGLRVIRAPDTFEFNFSIRSFVGRPDSPTPFSTSFRTASFAPSPSTRSMLVRTGVVFRTLIAYLSGSDRWIRRSDSSMCESIVRIRPDTTSVDRAATRSFRNPAFDSIVETTCVGSMLMSMFASPISSPRRWRGKYPTTVSGWRPLIWK